MNNKIYNIPFYRIEPMDESKRYWVNPFYCRNFDLFWDDIEFDRQHYNLILRINEFNVFNYLYRVCPFY